MTAAIADTLETPNGTPALAPAGGEVSPTSPHAPAATSATYTLPQNVKGWLAPAEGQQLEALAKDQVVLELGSYQGLSTICMARSAKQVHTIDWHRGDRGTRKWISDQWSLPGLLANLEKHGVMNKVIPYVGRFEDILTHFQPGTFDMVFVDGAHDASNTGANLSFAQRLCKPGGLIAMHDYDYRSSKAVVQQMGEPAGTVESLAWWGKSTAVQHPAALCNVFLGIPCYDSIHPLAVNGMAMATEHAKWTRQISCGSILTLVFNRLVTDALNSLDEHKWTHFAMLHSDIEVQPGWMDTLLAEMIRVDADLISVIVPIKDNRGLSSTGVRQPNGNIRRLTMKEVHKLPVTFTREAVCAPDEHLVVNTGLWIMRMDRPWLEKVLKFTIIDAVFHHEDGLWRAHSMPEDWDFSTRCFNAGLKVYATRLIPVNHYGRSGYTNQAAWGEWETDKGDES